MLVAKKRTTGTLFLQGWEKSLGIIRSIEPNEIIMSWACGVTPQAVAQNSKTPFMISHYPGHMFVTDKLSEELAIL